MEKEALENIVHEIKGRIADLKDMEKGVFNNAYVTVPGDDCENLESCFSWSFPQVARSALVAELLAL